MPIGGANARGMSRRTYSFSTCEQAELPHSSLSARIDPIPGVTRGRVMRAIALAE